MSTDDHEAELEIARIRDLLGLTDPAASPDTRQLARALNRIDLGEVPALDLEPAAEPVRSPTGRTGRKLPVMLAVAAVLALVVVAATTLLRPTPSVAAPPSLHYTEAQPADVITGEAPEGEHALLALAETARGSDVSGTGEVDYVATSSWHLHTKEDTGRASIVPQYRQLWLAPDGSATSFERADEPLRANGTLDSDPVPQPPDPETLDVIPPGSISSAYIDELPHDPADLEAALALRLPPNCTDANGTHAACLAQQISTLSTTFTIPPDLAAAFWEMLAEDEAVRTLGTAFDRFGREVVAIATPPRDMGSGERMHVVLIDPATGRFAGEEYITLESKLLDISEPTVTGFATVIASRLVPDIGETE